MILKPGEKVLIISRRFYKEDIRFHFIGEIIDCTENNIRIKGDVWVYENMRGFCRKPDLRENIIPFDTVLSVNIIPPEVNLQEIKYTSSLQKGHIISDGKKFSMEVTENLTC
jgi:hypothetical protein